MTTGQKLPARGRLLAAAEEAFFSRGIRATGVDELLRAANVSAASLYSHFGSKDGLVAEVLRIRLADWQSVWDECVVKAGSDLDRLLAVFDALTAYRERQPAVRWCAFLATATEMPDSGVEIAAVLAADTALLKERLRHFAEPLAGVRAADLADDVVLAYSGTLTAFLRGYPADPILAGRRVAAVAAAAYSP
ncbi:TetR/AcrR family transcriptional regulator [Arthrobacter sp. BL-252-APC-1A]|uniref:TetR/AcrR family transcriptional regulator n=1 Tax=Arthrobacter sp. BL-252-APC-1A TaxID=2606622 RepID=UPI0012B39642|nr:TetR/AcrR family transcriptional regulator [Arthrobacter sp. BL-252-APC-1A]MSR99933.1 TetR/AcrR family transcriptional regulator [Arthrobacter sp. BL-252-APC-1A]